MAVDPRKPSGRVAGASGRAPAAASGRAPAAVPASTSGRAPAVPAAGSGRAPAVPASGSNPRVPAVQSSGRMAPAPVGGSGRMAPAPSGSGRMPAPAPVPAPAAPAPRPSQKMMAPAPAAGPKSGTMKASARGAASGGRGGRSERRSVRGKAKAVGGKELMIAAAVLGGLVVAVIFFYVLRSGQRTEAEGQKRKLQETEDKNFRVAKEWGEKAWTAGLTFVMGKEETPPEQLKAVCQEPCYNVIYVRNRKDKKGREDSTQIEYSKDRLINGDIPSVSRDENGWHMVYAFAENKTIPLVRAQKTVQPQDGDTVNKPGTITVMVRAEEDDHFKRAREAKSPEENKDKGAGGK